MSASTLDRFWARVASDAAYRDALLRTLPGHRGPQDLARFASRTGFDVRAEDFLERALARTERARKALVPKEEPMDRELSDKALDGVAGGGSGDSFASAPLEMDIYATWDVVEPASPRAAPPQSPKVPGAAPRS